MKILLMVLYFPPETRSSANLYYELATKFIKFGHEVFVITTSPNTGLSNKQKRRKLGLFSAESFEGITVIRVSVPRFLLHKSIFRGIWEFICSILFFLAAYSVNPDIVLMYSPPLPLGLSGVALKKTRGIPFVFNVQDLYPQSIIDLGFLKNRFLIWFYERIECFIYWQADHITVHSSGNKEHVLKKGIVPDKVSVLPNWVDTDFLCPGEKNNQFRKELELNGKFVVSFGGVLGYSQNLDIILEAAKQLAAYPEIIFLIVGDGSEKQRLIEKAKSMELSNLIFLPMLPRERYPEMLHASDVSLATLGPEVKTPVVPSKIISIMAGGKPVIASMQSYGDAPKIIQEAGCGIVVSPNDPKELSEAVIKLFRDQHLCDEMGRKGREYAEKYFSLNAASKRYLDLFQKYITKRSKQ